MSRPAALARGVVVLFCRFAEAGLTFAAWLERERLS